MVIVAKVVATVVVAAVVVATVVVAAVVVATVVVASVVVVAAMVLTLPIGVHLLFRAPHRTGAGGEVVPDELGHPAPGRPEAP